jgi:aconitate hydratase
MVFDLDMIKKVYQELPAKISEARKVLGRPLTLTEKILYTHLSENTPLKNYLQG